MTLLVDTSVWSLAFRRDTESRAPQVAVDHEHAAVWLSDDGLGQIRGYERLSFPWNRAGDQESFQLLARSQLVQTRAQRPELLGAVRTQGRVKKYIRIRVKMP